METSYSADTALAEALARLKSVEDDNTALRSKVDELTEGMKSPSREGQDCSERKNLEAQNKEVCVHVF